MNTSNPKILQFVNWYPDTKKHVNTKQSQTNEFNKGNKNKTPEQLKNFIQAYAPCFLLLKILHFFGLLKPLSLTVYRTGLHETDSNNHKSFILDKTPENIHPKSITYQLKIFIES